MDPLPLIPKTTGNQNVAGALRESFQDTLDGLLYPKDIANNIVRYNVDTDLKFKQNACKVVEIHKKLNQRLGDVQDASHSIVFQHGSYLINIDKIDNIYDLKERTMLKHCKLFRDLKEHDIERFGLLQKYDLLPDAFKQFLDYRLNENLHLCEDCLNEMDDKAEVRRTRREDVKEMSSRTYEVKEDKEHVLKEDQGKMEYQGQKIQELKIKESGPDDSKINEIIVDPRKGLQTKGLNSYGDSTNRFGVKPRIGPREDRKLAYVVQPRKLQFHNCDVGRTYKKSVKLINISRHIQSINIGTLPKNPCFSVHLNLNSKIAPGMSVTARIIYKPSIYKLEHDCMSFRNNDGDFVEVDITVTREPPRLITCVFQSQSNLFERPTPGSSKFLEKRRVALNSTIDCRTCLIGEYVFLSLFVENAGRRGKFFIITEDEWYNQNIESISVSMELSNENIWIYPTYFELNHEEITEINIIFHPFEPGLHIEKYYILCDNNSFEQFEILGDALEFNKNMIKIDVIPNDTSIEKKEDYCIFLGNLMPSETQNVTLAVHNTSALLLECYWSFQHNPHNIRISNISESWINLLNTNKILAPYSTTDFQFEISLDAASFGYHSVFFSFFILDVPILSLCEDQEFIILEKDEISGKRLTKCADVQILKIEVACFVEIPETPITVSTESCACVPITPPKPKLTFSPPFIEFGILASGLSVKKVICVRSLSNEPVQWEISEVKYNVDTTPYMEVLETPNISCSSGDFSCPCESEEIWYFTKKEPMSWVSILLLMSKDEYDIRKIESICVVTYEVIDYDITIKTDNTEAPILCPLKLLYTGLPTTLDFIIENHSPITGCFYFLKPFGNDADKVEIILDPCSSTLNPMESKKITATIKCKEIGIFDSIFIPCFVGAGQEPIILSVLLAVDGVHMIFYLPEGKRSFRKVLWPPNIVYEYDEDWMICPCTMEESPEFLDDIDYSRKGANGLSAMYSSAPNLNDDGYRVEMGNLQISSSGNNLSNKMSDENSESTEVEIEMSNRSLTSTATASLSDINLRNILQEEFGSELYLQSHVVEMHRVPIKTATKFTFYFENNSPISTSYTIEATNFFTDKKFDDTLFKLKQKKLEEIWNDLIINQFGIVVMPEVDSGDIPVIGLIEVNLWVFANSWGIYMEEIVVEMPEVISFTFSLLIQVVGSPVIVPLALNSITELPTIRFGKVSYGSPEVIRKIKLDNTSGVTVNIIWHSFLTTSDDKANRNKFNPILDLVDKKYYPDEKRLMLTERYYGRETSSLFEMIPGETVLNGDSSRYVDLVMKPINFPPKMEGTDVRCFVIGHIYIEEIHRDIDEDFVKVRMEVLARLELSTLTLDFICGESKICIYANDVIFNKSSIRHVRLLFQNNNSNPTDVEVEIGEPFKILHVENGARRKKRVRVKPLGCLEVMISNTLNYQKILDLSTYLYKVPTADTDNVSIAEKVEKSIDVLTVDKENYSIRIQKDCIIRQNGVSELSFPMELNIYFPHIEVKPKSLKFESVIIGNSKKTLLSVFNMTGCSVKFEIYKTLTTDEIFITPHHGEIPKSTGVNKQFVDIFVYFTPRECKPYHESIRITTNIPNYYIEVPVKGTGSVNETYQVDYKI